MNILEPNLSVTKCRVGSLFFRRGIVFEFVELIAKRS